MSTENKTRLRDRREPGHFWADNEIIDVFGDELGQHGISVYVTMARFCFGTEVRMSLREIAAAARMSKSTVARSMKVLIALGLVIETKGDRAKTVSSWSLVNVKALVQELRSRTVPGWDRLIRERTDASVSKARNSTLVELVLGNTANCPTVGQMDSQPESVDKKICVASPGTDLSQNDPRFGTDLSHQSVALIDKTQDTKLKNKYNPLPPSQANGEQVSSSVMPACDEAVRKVMRELDIVERRMIPVIGKAIAAYRAKTDDSPDCNAVAELMIRRRGEYLALEGVLQYQVGIRKFFTLGVWADTRTWVLDRQEIHRQRRL